MILFFSLSLLKFCMALSLFDVADPMHLQYSRVEENNRTSSRPLQKALIFYSTVKGVVTK